MERVWAVLAVAVIAAAGCLRVTGPPLQAEGSEPGPWAEGVRNDSLDLVKVYPYGRLSGASTSSGEAGPSRACVVAEDPPALTVTTGWVNLSWEPRTGTSQDLRLRMLDGDATLFDETGGSPVEVRVSNETTDGKDPLVVRIELPENGTEAAADIQWWSSIVLVYDPAEPGDVEFEVTDCWLMADGSAS